MVDRGRARCEAPLKRAGRKCQKVAGWGTAHVGVGRCKAHDVLPQTVTAGLPRTGRIRTLADQFRRDRDPFDLREEIAITRAAIAATVDQLDVDEDIPKLAPALNGLLNTTGKLVQRLHEIEVGRQYVVHVDVVQRSIQQITAIVCEFIADPTARAEAAKQISQLAISTSGETSPNPLALTTRDQETVSLVQELAERGVDGARVDSASD